MTLAAGAVASLLSACGGGGGGGDGSSTPVTTPTSASLQVSGTAATGAALAGAGAEVKCATGTATATTNADGTYAVTIASGALPCMVEVKNTAAGATLTLHSVVESGTLDNATGVTTARADVTPVTDMIVAQMTAALPDDSFKGFQGTITAAQVHDAAAAIVAALRNAGLDLGTIDPLKANLVAASGSTTGDAYDRLLDALATKVGRDGLKMLVNQIAVSAEAGPVNDLSIPMQAVVNGSLAGCPVAVSGHWRTADVFGTVLTHKVDFKNMQLSTLGTTDTMALTADPSNACVFTASGKYLGSASTLKVVVGASGVATFRADMTSPSSLDVIGTMFPAQSHSYSDLRGTWSTLKTDLSARAHIAGQATFGEERQVSTCSYDANWQCTVAPATTTAVESSDGGVAVPVSSTEQVKVYGYRAPNGAFALFGGAVPSGNVAVASSSYVATKLATLSLPAVNTTVTSWDAGLNISPSSIISETDPSAITYTTTSVDATAGTTTRRNDDTGRVELLHFNQPLAGVRTRDGGTFNGSSFAQLVQIPLTGLGATISINAQPWGPGASFIHDIAVVKP